MYIIINKGVVELKKKKNKILNIIANILLVFSLVFTACLLYRNIVYGGVYIDGSSMEPTLHSHEYGYKNKTSAARKSVLKKRFKIVILKLHDDVENKEKIIVKRVIGLPNETIRIDSASGNLYVNEELVEQPFISQEVRALTCQSSRGVACDNDFVVPNNSIYVLGDNRGVSLDSERRYGAIPYENIDGVLRVIFKKCSEFKQSTCSYISPRWY